MPLPRFENLDESRRRSILAAAAEEFGERGFAAASYNQIIARAGISKGAMYYYFADKDDLFRTVLDTALSQWFAQVGMPLGADDAKSFWAACESTYLRTMQFMLSDPQNAALCLAVTRTRERLEGHPALLELNERVRLWTTELVHHGRKVGALRTDLPVELLVQIALSMMDAGDRWISSQWDEMTPKTVESTAKTMVDLLRRVSAKNGKSSKRPKEKRR